MSLKASKVNCASGLYNISFMPMDLAYVYRELLNDQFIKSASLYEVRILRLRFGGIQIYIWRETKRLKSIVQNILDHPRTEESEAQTKKSLFTFDPKDTNG